VQNILLATLLTVGADAHGEFPNDIALSPDEKNLHLNAWFKKMLRYDMRPNGTIGNARVFFETPPGSLPALAAA
jgi:sugar lactone lactonase YvrE